MLYNIITWSRLFDIILLHLEDILANKIIGKWCSTKSKIIIFMSYHHKYEHHLYDILVHMFSMIYFSTKYFSHT